MGTKEWWKYYSDGTTSTPTSQISTVKHLSGVLLGVEMREW